MKQLSEAATAGRKFEMKIKCWQGYDQRLRLNSTEVFKYILFPTFSKVYSSHTSLLSVSLMDSTTIKNLFTRGSKWKGLSLSAWTGMWTFHQQSPFVPAQRITQHTVIPAAQLCQFFSLGLSLINTTGPLNQPNHH